MSALSFLDEKKTAQTTHKHAMNMNDNDYNNEMNQSNSITFNSI